MRHFLAAAFMILSVAVQGCASAAPAAPQASPVPFTPPVPTEYVPTAIPITSTPSGCAYVWGSRELPQLSRQLNAELQQISLDLTGLAYAYGENCVYADGRETFSAMETDFRIGVKVKTVNDETALGDWIARVMAVVLALPEEQLQGPQSGRVDFAFKQPDPAAIFVTVPIEKYRNQAGNLRGAALLHFFYPTP